MPTIAPHELLDLIARAHKRTGIAVDELGDGGVSLLRWLASRRRVSTWAETVTACGMPAQVWHVDVNGETYTDSTLLLATLRAVAGVGE